MVITRLHGNVCHIFSMLVKELQLESAHNKAYDSHSLLLLNAKIIFRDWGRGTKNRSGGINQDRRGGGENVSRCWECWLLDLRVVFNLSPPGSGGLLRARWFNGFREPNI